MDWFLYDNGLRHERVKHDKTLEQLLFKRRFQCKWKSNYRDQPTNFPKCSNQKSIRKRNDLKDLHADFGDLLYHYLPS